VVDDTRGCFAALTLWYGAAAVHLALTRPGPAGPGCPPAAVGRLLSNAFPLFVSSLLWTAYLTGNRWLCAYVSGGAALGYFSFAANIAFLFVGSVATICQIYYPEVSRRTLAGTLPRRRVLGELSVVAIGLGIAAATAELAVGPLMRQAFPTYFPAVDAVRLMLVSAAPLALASWLLPLLLAVSRTPWTDCLAIFAGGFLLLAAGILCTAPAGLAWQAAGCLPGAVFVLGACLVRLCRASVLCRATAAALSAAAMLGVVIAGGTALLSL
ncbi:MAG TPA: oligosaccharide flippase family protein, partial [Rhodospirillaceae bacterium]|nr:oligosaccharide flippase family protein [Rhodospirillaceae bacterium]